MSDPVYESWPVWKLWLAWLASMIKPGSDEWQKIGSVIEAKTSKRSAK